MKDVKVDLRTVLPKVKENKKFIKRIDKREQKRIEEEQKEFIAVHGKKTSANNRKNSKKADAVSVKKKKERRPKTVIAKTPTGKETLEKHKAKQLVQERRKRERAKKGIKSSSKKGNISIKESSTVGQEGCIDEDLEKHLIMRTIQGENATMPGADVDPLLPATLYPDFPVTPEEKRASEDEVLEKANSFFQSLSRKEREVNRAAALHMKRLKEINRRGGDKDGFKYVLPKNTKELVRQMMLKEGSTSAVVDPTSLSSTFGAASVAEEQSDKPMRKSRRQGGTYSDFYQFQVSKRWTRNAEKFLFRDRVDKSLFESKKRQRSIKSL